MLHNNPLLTFLGRKGRGAVVDVLRAEPERVWSVRDLARAAEVPVITASRAVRELDALGVVDAFRPGRDKHIRWEQDSAVAKALLPFVVPNLREQSAIAFASSFERPSGARMHWWVQSGDDPSDPMCPTRIAVILPSDDEELEEQALDAIGPALDAVVEAGWPRPALTTHVRSQLGDDHVARAVLAGRVL